MGWFAHQCFSRTELVSCSDIS